MKNPYSIILKPVLTEKTMGLSYGNVRLAEDEQVRKYTFLVATDSNKIEIKWALEQIYGNRVKGKESGVTITKVNTIKIKGKPRTNFKKKGYRSDYKKAIVTLDKGQRLEDFGV